MEHPRAPDDDDAPRLTINKDDLKSVLIEVDQETHKNWRFEKVVPVVSLVALLGAGLGGAMFVQSINDRVAQVESAEKADNQQIEGQNKLFAQIATDSANTSSRLTAVEVKLGDVVDGIRRIELQQGVPGK